MIKNREELEKLEGVKVLPNCKGLNRVGLISQNQDHDEFTTSKVSGIYANLAQTCQENCFMLANHFKVHRSSYLLFGLMVLLGIDAQEALAFDLDAAGKALTDPVKAFIDTYWPVGVLAMGSGGALIAQGDMRTRAFGFGGGALLFGLMMAGVKVGLGI